MLSNVESIIFRMGIILFTKFRYIHRNKIKINIKFADMNNFTEIQYKRKYTQ